MQYIIAYDIGDDRRRTKVLSALKDFGFPVQFSVVECDLDGRDLARLKERLLPLIGRRDKLVFYPLCQNCWLRAERIGRKA